MLVDSVDANFAAYNDFAPGHTSQFVSRIYKVYFESGKAFCISQIMGDVVKSIKRLPTTLE